MKKANNKGRPYCDSTVGELEAITLLEYILDKNYIKAYLHRQDKIPNHDGGLEITDKEQYPFGEFKVQVKKSNNEKYPRKYSLDKEFLYYCADALLPVLVFVVDISNGIAYWIHMKSDLLESLLTRKNKTILVECPEMNVVKKHENGYVEEWKKIIEQEKQKKLDFEKTTIECENLKAELEDINKRTNSAYLTGDTKFREIHKFLDFYNNLLDFDFSIVKKAFYHEVWKLGIAIEEYTNRNIAFVKYPVYSFFNDVQIKFISPDNSDNIRKADTASWFLSSNPIKDRPESFSYQIIKKDIDSLLKNKFLLILDETLAIETLFEFIDEFYKLLNLTQKKNNYDIFEIEKGKNKFLPVWLDEAGLLNPNERLNVIDIDDINLGYDQRRITAINKKVKLRVSKDVDIPTNVYVKSTSFNYQYVLLLIDFLKSRQKTDLSRIFCPRVYPETNSSYYLWEVYNPQTMKLNLDIFFEHFAQVYDNIAHSFFPKLFKEICFYCNFNRLLIIAGEKLDPSFVKVGYEINYFYLENLTDPKEQKTSINFFEKGAIYKNDFPSKRFFLTNGNKPFEWEGATYKVKRYNTNSPDFMYEKRPLFNQVYDLLEKNLSEYLKIKIDETH